MYNLSAHFKKIHLLPGKVLAIMCFLLSVYAQELKSQVTVDWRDVASNGNWENGSNPCNQIGTANSQWWYSGWGPNNSRNRPDCYGNHIINFNNNHELNMSLSSLTFNAHKLVFASGNSSSRTIATGTINFYDHSGTWPLIQNNSSATHTINASIVGSSTHNIELSASSNSIIFGGTINNNGRTIQIYGNNSSVDATNRYISLTGVVSGSGILNVSRFGVAKLNGTHSYTGETQIDNGELWIESNGSIASGSGIYLGNGGQLANVAKLWLSNSSGSTNFSNNITINNGNTTTRYLGGLNTSGTHTFSGNITNNSSGGLYLSAENSTGTTVFSGEISGNNPVIISGSGTVVLSGTADNTYTGTTTVNSGILVLNKTAGKKAVGNNLIVTDGKTVKTDAANQLGTGTPALVTLQGSGNFNCNGFNQKIALASSSSTSLVSLGSAVLTIDNTMTDTYAGKISGTGGVSKSNVGTLILTGANDYTGTTTVSDGTMQFNRTGGSTIPATNNVLINGGTLKISTNQTLNDVTVTSGTLLVDAGSTLTINGTFTGGGTITNNGTIVLNTSSFPGSGSNINSMNNLTIDRGTNPAIILDKSLVVTGTLSLLSGTFDLSDKTLTINASSITRSTGDMAADMATVIFTNSTALTIPNQTFLNNNINNLTINGAGVSTAQSLNVLGNLVLTAGTLDIGATTFSYQGSSITRTSGDIDADAGNLEFNNSSALTLPSSLIKNGIIDNLTMNGAGGVTLGQSITVNTSIALANGILNIGNYNLTLDGTVSGTPGASKYIATSGNGFLKKKYTTSGSFTYPIGDGAYSPITINFNSGTFSSAYASARTDNTKHGSNISTSNYINRLWEVTQTGISAFNCNVTCVYDDNDIVGNEANIYCGKYNGTIWTLGNLANAANNTLTFNNNTSFSDFTGGELSAMPVTWLFHHCKPHNGKVQLTWGVSEEPATGIYTIERSAEGRNWKALGTKTPLAPSFTSLTYNFVDPTPLTQNFYRIKYTENNGKVQFSEICHTQQLQSEKPIIRTDAGNNEISVSFANQAELNGTVTLYDATGRKLRTSLITGNSCRLSTAGLPQGIYELMLEGPGYRLTEKLMLTGN